MALIQGGGAKKKKDQSKGLLINNNSGLEVDLWMINSEEVEIVNDLTGDVVKDRKHISEHLEPRPTRIHIEGILTSNKYDEPYKDIDEMPVEKLNKFVKFLNDADATYKLVAPALPYTYIEMYPTNFTYRNEGESNAVNYILDLEEVGLAEGLPNRHQTKSTGGGPDNHTPNRESSSNDSANISKGNETEDGGTKEKAGKKPLNSLVDSLLDEGMNWLKDMAGEGLTALGNQALDTLGLGGTLASWLGADGKAIERAGEDIGREVGEWAGSFLGPVGQWAGGELGAKAGEWLGDVGFDALESFGEGAKDVVSNTPIIGDVCSGLGLLPGGSEFVLEVSRNNSSTVLWTMGSPIFRRFRSHLLDVGLKEIGVPSGKITRLKDKKILTDQGNREIKRATIAGMNKLGLDYKSKASLREYVNNLPAQEQPSALTFYNYYAQPVLSFQGFLDVNFDRWMETMVELNGQDYMVETYWNRAGFPVFSLSHEDGTPITKEVKATLGSDLLDNIQGSTNLNGVHIVPVPIAPEKEITKENVGNTIKFLVVYTNKRAIDEVLA